MRTYSSRYRCLAINNNLTAASESSLKINMLFPPLAVKISSEGRPFAAGNDYFVRWYSKLSCRSDFLEGFGKWKGWLILGSFTYYGYYKRPLTIIIFLVGFGWSTRLGISSCNNSEINFQQTRWKYHGKINVGIYNQRQYGSWYILWFFRSEKFQRSGRQFCLKVNELIIFITGIAEEYFHPLLIVNSQT